MATFIYCPRSGDRVFSQKFNQEIVVLKWNNGSRHVSGGFLLQFDACGSKREAARRFCAQIVQAVGGIAFDAQGCVSCILPVGQAHRVYSLATEILDAPALPDTTKRMFKAGLLCIGPDLKPIACQAKSRPEIGSSLVDTEAEEKTRVDIVDQTTGETVDYISAPADWNLVE